MEGIVMQCNLSQGEATSVDRAGNIVLDIESLTQSSDKCSGSPKMTKALSRKGSSRMERRNGEEQDADETTKKVTKVVCCHLEQFKQSSGPNKTLIIVPTSANASISDAGDGRLRKFNHLTAINPRRILLLLASLSSMGTMILIYFTLAIYWRQSFS